MGAFDFLFGKTEEKEPYKGTTLDNQPLFNLSDSESKYVHKSRFLFLSSISKKDKATYKKVKQAIMEMGYTDDVVFVSNNSEVLKFGVVNTPAIVVDGKVVSYGKDFEVEEVKELFERYSL